MAEQFLRNLSFSVLFQQQIIIIIYIVNSETSSCFNYQFYKIIKMTQESEQDTIYDSSSSSTIVEQYDYHEEITK